MNQVQWCAIGDSFTYLNDHLDETAYRVSKGYLTRINELLPELVLNNIGINGSTFADWVHVELPKADLYTVLLGTNDWGQGLPLGTGEDFINRTEGTIAGHFGILLDHIREANPEAKILVANPVERGDFVYVADPLNNHQGSYAPWKDQNLSDIAAALLACCRHENVACLDLYHLSGFAQDRLVRFKRVRTEEGYKDLPFPEYVGVPFDPEKDDYPYPPEAADLTYDGLHPSDQGCEILAGLFALAIRRQLQL